MTGVSALDYCLAAPAFLVGLAGSTGDSFSVTLAEDGVCFFSFTVGYCCYFSTGFLGAMSFLLVAFLVVVA